MYKDIIERAIEQFAAGIAKIMHLRQIKKEEEAGQVIEQELLKHTGMFLKNILALPENITAELAQRKYADQPAHLIYLADLLKEQGEMFLKNSGGAVKDSSNGVSNALKCFRLSLALLEAVLEPIPEANLEAASKDPSKNEDFSQNKKILKRIKYLKEMVGETKEPPIS